eukprot:5895010-Amphidinium_carterae.1
MRVTGDRSGYLHASNLHCTTPGNGWSESCSGEGWSSQPDSPPRQQDGVLSQNNRFVPASFPTIALHA